MDRPSLFVVILAVMAVVSWFTPTDDSDPPGGRSGMGVYRDALTGCEYLGRISFFSTAITPRMNREGKQICR